jgi:AcrR family transcriptional regulator
MDVRVQERVYTKDPNTTDLGQRIVGRAIALIDELGLERFTIGKLAGDLGTTETSVYRYFANKQKLLIYLVDWYWAWREIKLAFDTANIEDARERLRRGLRSVTEPILERGNHPHVDLAALYRIAVSESAKAWLNKDVDAHDEDGHFGSFVRLSHRLRDLVLAVDARHAYATDLATIVLECGGSLHYFHQHLPKLTGRSGGRDRVVNVLTDLVFSTIQPIRKA